MALRAAWLTPPSWKKPWMTPRALASTFHTLFLEPLIQGLALIAQWVEFGSNDVRGWQSGEVLTPERTGFRMQWIGSRHIHLVA
ncbi:Uncharacterised protein [Salmonella enterica subsp. enterica]|nr:Uncharacterised protein [Salmonella enterica subsp. enterica]